MSPSQQTITDYTSAHTTPQGPGDSRPTAHQVLHDEGLLASSNRLSNKTILITGGTSGLGLEAAKAFHATGGKVFITGRCDPSKGREIAAAIETNGATARQPVHPVTFVPMDLADLDSVRDGAASFLRQSGNKLNVLICNAGIMAPKTRLMTVQGHEMQFGVNHLAHFLLVQKFSDVLVECSTKEFASRVVSVSSCAHRNGGLVADGDYDFEKTTYDPGLAYGQSKTANIYMANELERRFGAKGLHGLSVHPGIIMETGIVRHMTDDNKKLEEYLTSTMPMFGRQTKNAQQGAGCIVWAAVTARLEATGGLYLEDCGISTPVREGLKDDEWFEAGRSSWCYDRAAEEKLWSDSEDILASWL